MKALILALILLAGCAGDKRWKIRPYFKIGHGQHAISHRVEVEVGTYGYYGISKWGIGWNPSFTASNHTDPWFGMPYPGAVMLSWEMRE